MEKHLKKPVAGIVLAAGISSRFGRPKQLLCLEKEYLLERIVTRAVRSRLDKVLLVLGNAHETISRQLGSILSHPKVKTVINTEYCKGLSQSLRAGLSAVGAVYPSAMFILGDQPLISTALLNQLLEAYLKSDKSICAPVCRGIRRNPVIVGRCMYTRLLKLQGDKGARAVIDADPEKVLYVEKSDPRLFLDIDTTSDYETLTRLMESEIQET